MNKENMNIPVLEPLNETDDIYQRNLHALEKHHPELIEIIETISVDEDRVRVVKSESESSYTRPSCCTKTPGTCVCPMKQIFFSRVY